MLQPTFAMRRLPFADSLLASGQRFGPPLLGHEPWGLDRETSRRLRDGGRASLLSEQVADYVELHAVEAGLPAPIAMQLGGLGEADQADAGAIEVLRRRAKRAVQGGALPVLRARPAGGVPCHTRVTGRLRRP